MRICAMRISPIRRAAGALVAGALAACAGTVDHRLERERGADATLAGRVKVALVEDDRVDAAAVFVDARGGTVRLSGFADNSEERGRAVAVARGVRGVGRVESNIALR